MASSHFRQTDSDASNDGVSQGAHLQPIRTIDGSQDVGERVTQPISALESGRVSQRTANATQRARRNTQSGGRRASGGHEGIPAPLAVGLVVAVLALVAIVVLPRLSPSREERNNIEAGVDVEVIIPEGSGASAIADILFDAGVIETKSAFSQALRKQEAEQSLRSGSYLFQTLTDANEVVRQLVEGPNNTQHVITVPEGLTVAKTAAIVEEGLGIPASEFIEQAKASNYVADYPFLEEAQEDSIEGFLYPKTYDFAGKELSSDLVIRTMLDQYQLEVGSIDFDSYRAGLAERFNQEFSNYQLLKIASIIERETNTDEDRKLVASVIHNRIWEWMPLQCDSTIEYVVGGVPTAEDLTIDSPYNTYTNYGLPPTPICSPSIESIMAALEPERTNLLYFYINGDYHVFSDTYEQHQEAIANAPTS